MNSWQYYIYFILNVRLKEIYIMSKFDYIARLFVRNPLTWTVSLALYIQLGGLHKPFFSFKFTHLFKNLFLNRIVRSIFEYGCDAWRQTRSGISDVYRCFLRLVFKIDLSEWWLQFVRWTIIRGSQCGARAS